ncbi:hemerythrin-like metal-binding domain protein [Campylobacter iguaniorum]|uniref:bacteriohemerythrin n=1 Tax=Campylobacter iguaniorum TaxID=1244531 RepID=UPI0007C9161C|nr:bacteriohemerythrin [Campylobacter iguaniorum]ANE36517.1 hemerythrin-like metal-binding domain protein [Campylobacter iguaniorum]
MIPPWSEKYSINNYEIDEQHKKLFELAKKAYIYANNNISKDDMRQIIVEFFDYMKEHFNQEESYMRQIGYPKLIEHSKIHRDIISTMSNLIRSIKNINEMKENLVTIAEKWLLEHILQDDIKIEEWNQHQKLNLASKTQNTPALEQEKKYEYVCECPKKIHIASQRIHDKITKGARFVCKVCNKPIKPHSAN